MMGRLMFCIFGVIFSSASSDRSIRHPNVKVSPDYNAGVPPSMSITVGDITGFHYDNFLDEFIISCNETQIKVIFYREDIVRVWLAWNGTFHDPASDIVIGNRSASVSSVHDETNDYYEMRSSRNSNISLRASKSPMQLSMYRSGTKVWSESHGLSHNSTATTQKLFSGEDEYFFGGGMQNGRWSHKGHRIGISTDENWAEGGNPNAAPTYVSSAGFAVYRNTWSPGFYDFSQPSAELSHNETRFDAFYVVSAPRDFKSLLEGYTFITGRPFMPPVYGLSLGDSDCYHNERHQYNTSAVLEVAEKYRKYDLPRPWFLWNDGYGCGFGEGADKKFPHDFKVLEKVVKGLNESHSVSGMWSSTGLPNFTREVKDGVFIAKTDVGWVGDGYKFAFDAVKGCAEGIEKNSDARRFVWTVEGWAGTHRMAVMWLGDNSGSFDYLRWQVPTFIGCGFSAQAHVSGDVDGIYGGSPETYVRDLQFKSFMTVGMTMSGWASNKDKQPWTWGEPYTTINRKYLKLKSRLTPYFYTLSREAHDTGVPPVRAMALEFPNDVSTFQDSNSTSHQFMAGPSFLVAPVFTPIHLGGSMRNDIYLPDDIWVDAWNRNSVLSGPKIVNGYDAPLDKLPLFVRAGAIVPMWPEMDYLGQKEVDPLTLEVYPGGESSFQLYEDDGKTREALEGTAFSKTNISCSAGERALESGGKVTLTVGASIGHFMGKLSNRSYDIRVQFPTASNFKVVLATHSRDNTLTKYDNESALANATSGWTWKFESPAPTPTPPTPPTPTPPGIVKIHNKSACKYQTDNVGIFHNASDCAKKAERHDMCFGYLMFSETYPNWGCRCCTSSEAANESQDLWDMFEYWGIHQGWPHANHAAVLVVKTVPIPTNISFNIIMTPPMLPDTTSSSTTTTTGILV